MNPSQTKCCSNTSCTFNNKGLVITIDGPSGAGKTTLSKMLAERLAYRYIDTGALYRGVAFEAQRSGVPLDDDDALAFLCKTLAFDFTSSPEGLRLISNGIDISDFIRTPKISMMASAVSARLPVRKCLIDIQRYFGRNKRVIFEGRDMGTVVFPEADIKFFLMASPKIRAERRFNQMDGRNHQTLAQVAEDMQKRDADDSSRSLAPLKPADDAILIDSTNLGLDAVVEVMMGYISGISEPFQDPS